LPDFGLYYQLRVYYTLHFVQSKCKTLRADSLKVALRGFLRLLKHFLRSHSLVFELAEDSDYFQANKRPVHLVHSSVRNGRDCRESLTDIKTNL
jgi:hypothetical protein